MNSRHLVDPELLEMGDTLSSVSVNQETLHMMRAAFKHHSPPGGLRSNDKAIVEERSIPGPPGAPPVRVLIYSPHSAATLRPALLHLHGGGYVIGAPEMNDVRNRELVAQLGCVIVSVDYRLAPETPFPGALEDSYAALKWLHDNAGQLDVDAHRIAVGGESAGGGLSASLALLARDRGEVPILFQLLIYPTIENRSQEADPHPYTGEFVWRRASSAFSWSSLLDGSQASQDFIDAYAQAGKSADLAGLPPAFIGVGTLDLNIEQDMDFARRLTRAGVPVTLCVYAGAYHGFDLATDAAVTKRFVRDYTDALRRAFEQTAQINTGSR